MKGRSRRVYLWQQAQPFKNGMTANQILNEINLLGLQGKTNEEIAELLGYANGSSISNILYRYGKRNPDHRKKCNKRILTYEEAIKKLKDKGPLDFREAPNL